MGCGQIHLGGCYDPDLMHDGPCKMTPDDKREGLRDTTIKTCEVWEDGEYL